MASLHKPTLEEKGLHSRMCGAKSEEGIQRAGHEVSSEEHSYGVHVQTSMLGGVLEFKINLVRRCHPEGLCK